MGAVDAALDPLRNNNILTDHLMTPAARGRADRRLSAQGMNRFLTDAH